MGSKKTQQLMLINESSITNNHRNNRQQNMEFTVKDWNPYQSETYVYSEEKIK